MKLAFTKLSSVNFASQIRTFFSEYRERVHQWWLLSESSLMLFLSGKVLKKRSVVLVTLGAAAVVHHRHDLSLNLPFIPVTRAAKAALSFYGKKGSSFQSQRAGISRWDRRGEVRRKSCPDFLK